METVFQYEIPVLHPVAVHFPIGLLIVALGVSIVWLVLGSRIWRRAASLFVLAGTAGAVFAYVTGEAMHDFSEDVPIVEELIDFHQDLALVTLVMSIALSLSFVALELWHRRFPAGDIDPLTLRITGSLLLLALACLVAFTGHVGGIMVWGVAR